MLLHCSSIQPERNLTNIAVEMLDADLMPCTVDAAFQKRPNALNAVRGSKPTLILSSAVIHSLVSQEHVAETYIGTVLVCQDHRSGFNVLKDCTLQGSLIG